MNKSTIIISVRLLAIFCFAQSYSNSIHSMHLFESQNVSNSWRIYLYAVLFIIVVPILLWFIAPLIARLNLKHQESQINTLSPSDLLSIGVLLLGVYMIPDALLYIFGSINEMLIPRENFNSAEIWQYSASVRRGLISGISKLALALFFICSSKKLGAYYFRE